MPALHGGCDCRARLVREIRWSTKWLRGLSRPHDRLRVGDNVRVFYDVTKDAVELLAIVRKSAANDWLKKYGDSDEESASDPTQG
jgi:hypothetical protein